MALEQRLQQKQVQKMIMSVKMQQSMHILQLPLIELNELIAEEISTNPLLEESQTPDNTLEITEIPAMEIPSSSASDSAAVDQKIKQGQADSKLELEWMSNDNIWSTDFTDKNKANLSSEKHDYQQSLLTKSSTLQDELTQQFHIINSNPEDWRIAEQLIGNIEENGYLSVKLEEIAQTLDCAVARTEEVLKMVQELDPAGVAARDLKECLIIQLRRQGKENSTEAVIIQQFLPELAAKKYAKISKALKIPLTQIKKHVENIGRLDPKPCRNFSQIALRIVPDILLEKTGSGYDITINSKSLPQFSISQLYKKMLKDKSCPTETLKFIKEKMQNAQNLISGISQREQTLEKVTRCIIDYQQDFIEKGTASMKPLTLKEIAEKLEVHPSTISRTVANKYIQTPYGTFALKNFFSQSISSEGGDLSNQKVKATIDELVKTESSESPLSDLQIMGILSEKGIHISRRTVTKYRNALKIPAAHLRKG
ncbi:MAG: RNA polymerase factor sigma-54 [Candidatus Omnitrophota bacterium]